MFNTQEYLEDSNLNKLATPQNISQNIITDPNLIPNGKNQVKHNTPETQNNNVEVNNDNLLQTNEIIEAPAPAPIITSAPAPIITSAPAPIITSSPTPDVEINIDEIVRKNSILNKKNNDTYSTKLLASYANNKKDYKPVIVKKLKRSTLNELMEVFSLSVVILLAIFIMLLIVCMKV